MAELGLFKAILGLKKAELELFGGNIQVAFNTSLQACSIS